jgi:hypothetical protein
MEEKKEYLDEWTNDLNFEKPFTKNIHEKLLNKKLKRENGINEKDSKNNKNSFENELNKKDEIHQEIIIGDASDLTDDQKMKGINLNMQSVRIIYFHYKHKRFS